MAAKRWIILAENGGNAVVSNDRSPENAILVRAADGLSAMGYGGWLAVEDIDGKSVSPPRMVVQICPSRRSWDDAVKLMDEVRAGPKRSMAPLPPDEAVAGGRW